MTRISNQGPTNDRSYLLEHEAQGTHREKLAVSTALKSVFFLFAIFLNYCCQLVVLSPMTCQTSFHLEIGFILVKI